jgi:uncharacterized protein (TIGR03435 family)
MMRAPGLIIETKNGRARITAKAVLMRKFADMLSARVGRPVIDSAGLTANYSFAVYFTQEVPTLGDADRAEKVPTKN